MNGSETLMAACSHLRSQTFKWRILGSWLRLRCAARLLPLRGSGLTLLIALTLRGLLGALALSVFALPVLGWSALRAPAVFFAWREIGRRRLLVLADDDLGAVGQIGKARLHHAIGVSCPAPHPGTRSFPLRHPAR